MSDPVMRQVLNDMSTDPKAAQEHQKNPMVMAKIQKLINAGIVQTATPPVAEIPRFGSARN